MYRSAVCYAGHAPPKGVNADTEMNSKSWLLILHPWHCSKGPLAWMIYYSFIDSFVCLLDFHLFLPLIWGFPLWRLSLSLSPCPPLFLSLSLSLSLSLTIEVSAWQEACVSISQVLPLTDLWSSKGWGQAIPTQLRPWHPKHPTLAFLSYLSFSHLSLPWFSPAPRLTHPSDPTAVQWSQCRNMQIWLMKLQATFNLWLGSVHNLTPSFDFVIEKKKLFVEIYISYVY